MWPDYFPDQCPPNSAREEQLRVFRLVANCPPSIQDFVPVLIEQPHRKFDSTELCLACGVSVFKNIEDANKRRKRFKPLRNKQIAVGLITQEDGLILETCTDSHVTWWLQTEEPHRNFREASENVPV